jgi:phosphoglycerol transferase MdoB-like AlkP superfamily enzyme
MPYHAFMLDLSMIAYLLAIPLLLITIQHFISKEYAIKLIKIYSLSMACIYLMIAAAEINLFAEWQTKIDYRAIVYLKTPSEVFETATYGQTFLFFIYLIVVLLVINIFYKYLVPISLELKSSKIWNTITSASSTLIVGVILIILGIRGGVQQIPINQSWAYYSNNNTINLASVNSLWNLLGSIYQNSSTLDQNPYVAMPFDEAKQRVSAMHSIKKDTTIHFLNSKKPNIVFLILESFSADLIQSCGGDSGITPQIEKLISSGYLFSNIYSSGTLSHQGIASIFSGFPAQPTTSIIKEHAKFSKLPSLNKKLIKLGYNTSFYFGGQLTYANIKSYMYFNQFHKIKDIGDYESKIPRGKLGIHDQYTLSDHIQELNQKPEPFFSGIFTVSTHSPYDIPMKWKIDKGGNERDFLNAAWYSDSCIGAYVNECKKQNWYKNTLFVIIADHSKHTHYDRNYFEPLNRHIPLLFFGDVLKDEFKGKINSTLGSQNDLVCTLLKQLNQNTNEFKWSKNLMNPYTQQYFYYALINGFGLAVNDGWLAYNYQSKKNDWIDCKEKTLEDSLLNNGKAYLQVLFQEYLDY